MAGARETPGNRRDRDAAVAEAWDEVRGIEALWLPESARAVAPRTASAAPVQPAAEEMEFVEPDARPQYGRRPGASEQRVMIASAAKIEVNDRKAIQATRRRRQAWQTEAWDYSYEVPEVGATLDFVADLMSKLKLFPATRPDPKGPPLPVDAEDANIPPDEQKIATEVLEALRSSEGGQSVIQGDMAFNFSVAGEMYLHGHEDADTAEKDWRIRSVDELVTQGDEFALRTFLGSNQLVKVPNDDVVIRMWRRDRRFGNMAMAHMRRLLSACENLLLLDREVRSASQSRLTNGFMLWPNGMSLGPKDQTRDPGDGHATDDPFLADLLDAQVTAVQEPGSAAAFAPINVQGADGVLEKVRHVKIERQIDNVLDKRIEAHVLRLARGLPAPVEVTTGLQETTFANAAQVKKSEWDSYGEPLAVLIVDAITAGYYQWMLVEAGMSPERAREHFVWYDPSDCIAAPDPIDSADTGAENGWISAEAWRRVRGFSEDDAPTDDEILRLMLIKMNRQDPFVAAQMLEMSGIAPGIKVPAPQSGIINTTTGEVIGAPPPAGAAAITAAADGLRLGKRLMLIDRDLRTRVRTAAELAMRRVLERAGNRIKDRAAKTKGPAAEAAAGIEKSRLVAAGLGKKIVSALGLDDEALVEGGFSELAEEFGAWVDVAYGAAVGEIDRAIGPLDEAARSQLLLAAQRSRDSASDWLSQQMTRLAAARLYNPEPGIPAVGESASTIPEWIVRGAVAIAGGQDPKGGDGAPITTDDGSPLAGVATGPLVLTNVEGVEAYQWDYGSAPRQPYEPHLELDGVMFESFEDEILANDEGWPPTDFYFPGDHDGCVCDVTPIILVGPAEGDQPTGDDGE